MNEKKSLSIAPNGPPQGSGPSREVYQLMGEDNIFAMLEEFYEELGKSEIREMFPVDVPDGMKEASKKSAAFFVGILGGPALYHQRHGSPMMRKRHLAFRIDGHARQVWLATFLKVLETADQRFSFPIQHKQGFINFLEEFSAWMVNTQ